MTRLDESLCVDSYFQFVTSLLVRCTMSRVPDQSVFASDPGPIESLTLNAAVTSAGGEWVLAYIASNTTVELRMDKITAADPVTAYWIDPTTGDRA